MHDHSYSNTQSPRKVIKRLFAEKKEMKKKLKATQMKNQRFKKKVKSLQNVVDDLKKKKLVSDECAAILETTFSGVPQQLMRRIVQQKKSKSAGAYSPELRSFALTLKYYSSKAYRFVRKSFDLGLPHPSVIRSWYSIIDADPGFTKPAFTALSAKVAAAKKTGEHVICSMMIDEMSIRKHLEWNGKECRGYVDLGTGSHDDSLPVATNALVFMLVSMNSNWKIPVGYFLIDGMTGKEKASLVTTCLEKLHDIGVTVAAFTCDGPSAHFAMLKELGAKLAVDELIPHFPHPSDPSIKIHVFLDACHMLKLVRNAFGHIGVLYDGDGNEIRWEYLEKLHDLQDTEGLHLANKLRSAHINWRQQKMKVNLAAQALSTSVADAIDYCYDHLKMEEFSNCHATTKFIRIFDRLFDVLNSRNPLSRNYKAPLRPSNYACTEKFLDEAYAYIIKLKNSSGTLLTMSKQKTGFLGFMIAIKSVKALYCELVASPKPHMKYLLTYKISQDHLELFFSAIRAAGGWNNNPTASQFTSAYKKLLMRHKIEGGNGNCEAQDETTILNNIKDQCSVNNLPTGTTDMQNARRYDLTLRAPITTDHDYCDISNEVVVSEYKEAAITYIAGFVCKTATKQIGCPECITALTKQDAEQPHFVTWKSNGGLVIPSKSVIEICTETEKCIMRMLNMTGGKLPNCKNLLGTISTAVLATCVGSSVFKALDNHMFDTTATNNHIAALIKCCAQSYTHIRLKHHTKRQTDIITGKKVRKQLTKLILFNHQ